MAFKRLATSVGLVFLFVILIEGRLKCKGGRCQWFGSCPGGSPGCPKGYVQNAFHRCLNGRNQTTGEMTYHCCKQNSTQPRSFPPYLTPEDHEKSLMWMKGPEKDIPMPYDPPETLPTKNFYRLDYSWPGAQAGYWLDPSFSAEDRAELATAFRNYQESTCFNFYPKKPEDKSYISIEDDKLPIKADKPHCGIAQVCGPRGYNQYVKLAKPCRNAEWMIHEIGHALCFFHEHDRFDRDTYIYFDSKNVDDCQASEKHSQSISDTTDLPFDWKSSQLYKGCAPGTCIQRKPGQGYGPCGNKWDGTGRLSNLDIKKFNRYYKCDCKNFKC